VYHILENNLQPSCMIFLLRLQFKEENISVLFVCFMSMWLNCLRGILERIFTLEYVSLIVSDIAKYVW
jgi:hypothetical protein